VEASSGNNTNKTMTKQEIYDKVCKHLAKQKTRATVLGSCAYRTDDGKKCAVGCLIPYHVWRKEVGANNTGVGLDALCEESPWAKKNFGRNLNLLTELQNAHDSDLSDAQGLRENLRDIAKCYRIKPGAEQAIKVWNP